MMSYTATLNQRLVFAAENLVEDTVSTSREIGL